MSIYNHIIFLACLLGSSITFSQNKTDSLISEWERTGVPPNRLHEYKEYKASAGIRNDWKNSMLTSENSSEKNAAVAVDSCKNVGFEDGNYNSWFRFKGWVNSGVTCPAPQYSSTSYTPPGSGGMAYNATVQSSGFYVINSQPSGGTGSPTGNDELSMNGSSYMLPEINVGSYSARINNALGGSKAVRAEYVFQVPLNQPYFIYDWAAVMSDGNHNTGDQAAIRIQVKTMQGNLLNIPNAELINDVNTAITSSQWVHSSEEESGDDVYYHPWRRDTIHLCAFAGQNIRIAFEALDCSFGGHFCYMYLDARCNYEPQTPASVSQNSLCPDSTNFNLTASGGFLSYQWLDPNGNNISAAQTGTNQILDLNAYQNNCPSGNCDVNEGDVFAVLLYSPGGCSLKVNHTIQLNEVTLQDYTVTATCKEAANGVIAVTPGGGLGAGTYSYQWFAGNCSGNSIGNNPILSNVNNGTYCVIIASGECPPFSQSFTVNINPMETQSLTQAFPPCLDSVTPISVAGNNPPISWYQNGNLLNETNDTLWINPFDYPDVYSVTYHDSSGCKDSLMFTTLMAEAEKKFAAKFCPRDSLALVYIPASFGADSVQWYYSNSALPDTLGGNNDTIPYGVAPSQLQNFYVTWEENGCKKIAWKFDQVFPDHVFFPDTTVSIFSPNNDKINDTFYPFAEKDFTGGEIEKESAVYKLRVYNRWGTLVFESDSFSAGWDGRNKSGDVLQEGTYFWIAEFESNCRNENPLMKTKGYVQLVR